MDLISLICMTISDINEKLFISVVDFLKLRLLALSKHSVLSVDKKLDLK